eukprot:m.88451 g.88451  ORF g.88451 m.88451 type:complete len:56 (-) comp51009_c0_seq28:423-590(-)
MFFLSILVLTKARSPFISRLQIKSSKRSIPRDVFERMTEAKSNLIRFIQYKQSQF